MQHRLMLGNRWLLTAVGTSLAALPIAATVQPQVATVVQWQAVTLLIATAVMAAERMLDPMRRRDYLQILLVRAQAEDLRLEVLDEIRGEIDKLTKPQPEPQPHFLSGGRRSTDKVGAC